MPVDAQIQTLLDVVNAAEKKMHEGTPEEARAAFRTLTVDFVKPEDVVPVGSVEELTVAGRPARLYRPEGAGETPTLVFFHGGGYVLGDLDTHDPTCRRICAGAETTVLAIDYRLAPEHPFPAGVEDAIAATRWAAEHLHGTRLAVGGDSAGGNLSAVVAQTLPDLVQAQVLLYPAVDKFGDYPSREENAEGYFLDTPTMTWFLQQYVGGVADLDPADPRLSPLLGDLSGVAPALVVTAEFDPLRDEGNAYAAELEAAGVSVDQVTYPGLIHGFMEMGPWSPAAADAVDDVIARIGKLLRA
ncbi:alpha/beta hydrolase [Nocardioides ungokensis]|uniref:alpha/beta hydrolase n=1 Tax=Nocardioides ungokensis TaxID=1643322 RepID=UPI0015DE8442|nr:alpha/beta hydrolase [Nocardioides ungokensis]